MTVQRKEKDFEGMMEFCREDEALLVKTLITGRTTTLLMSQFIDQLQCVRTRK